jgi:hypothetical protein
MWHNSFTWWWALDKKCSTGPIRPAQSHPFEAGGLVRVSRVSRVHWSGFFWLMLGGFGWMKWNHRHPYPTDPIHLYSFIIISYLSNSFCLQTKGNPYFAFSFSNHLFLSRNLEHTHPGLHYCPKTQCVRKIIYLNSFEKPPLPIKATVSFFTLANYLFYKMQR